MRENEIQNKSIAYAKRIVAAYQYLCQDKCAETLYWLELLASGGYFTDAEYQSLYSDGEELRKILSSITKSVRDHMEDNS